MSLMDVNESQTPIFAIAGLKDTRLRYVVFFLVLLVYLLIIFLNLTLLLTIILEKSLHYPMYLFLCNLCVNGLYGTTGFYPKFLSDLFSSSYVISYRGCFIQSFIIYTSLMCEFTTLVILAFDRYVAICRPLEYNRIVTIQTVTKLILYSWTLPFLAMFPSTMLATQLPLCGSQIDKLYCDNWSIIKLSCVPTVSNNVYGFMVLFTFMAHIAFVLYSYQRLVMACRKSKDDRKKFMQTCIPHLFTVMNFTVAVLFDVMFSRFGSEDFPEDLRNFLQIEILIIPPIFNPLMYGLKLSEVRRRLFRQLRGKIMNSKHIRKEKGRSDR